MTLSERETVKLYDSVCCGNRDALMFVFHWGIYCHGIDDIIDGNPSMQKSEEIISAFAQANVLYSLPFYRDNWSRLQPVVMLVTNAYADSVSFEGSEEAGKKTMSDVLRFAGNEMLFAVALICGGYAHMRKLSAEIRENSWRDHHNEQGERT